MTTSDQRESSLEELRTNGNQGREQTLSGEMTIFNLKDPLKFGLKLSGLPELERQL